MLNVTLFISTVLIWGTTWIAIAFQIGTVSVLVSVFYRFGLAAIFMMVGLILLRKLRRPEHWRFVILQALCLFCFNFIAFYNATALIPSGLVSVIFSLASIFNAINARLFFGERITPRILLAGVIGMCGLVLLFWQDLVISANIETVYGILWATLGTLFFSWGNMASRRNTSDGTSPVCANAWGMGIGALALLFIILITNTPITAPPTLKYWNALIYLAVIGSVIGFTVYLMLVGRIGAVRASYATVLFPVIALLISTVYEGYQWHPTAYVGIALTMLGNLVIFSPNMSVWQNLKARRSCPGS